MVKSPLVTLRPMTTEDIPAGMRLKNNAGWNQTERDWTMILNASLGGCFVAVINETVVGTITTLSYDRTFSWLGMLLVAPEYRRHGIGTMLFKSAIDFAKGYGTICLDATPAGAPLYRSLGFVDTGTLLRMERPGNAHTTDQGFAQPLSKSEIFCAICEYDAPVFGTDRRCILTTLYENAPQYGFVSAASSGGHAPINGYCLGRSGSHSEQLGPLVADTEADAQYLLSTALKSCMHRSVLIDVTAEKAQWIYWLEQQGFVKRRSFTRMVLGSQRIFGQMDKQYAIAGPEIG